MNNQTKIQPEVELDGAFCYCPICSYKRLLPTKHSHCPDCNVELDWDWFYKLKVKKEV